jgi:hypothetical protein
MEIHEDMQKNVKTTRRVQTEKNYIPPGRGSKPKKVLKAPAGVDNPKISS